MIRWTKERNMELARLYATMEAAELAEHFGTTCRAIWQQAHCLGLRKEQPRKIRLDERQELWLRLNFPHVSNLICAMILGVSVRTVVRMARRMRLMKTARFMRECQAHMAGKARESHIRNGTYPPKGWYSPNLQKGERYRFKPGERRSVNA